MRRVMEAAYAKVNLTLTVTGRRADGYHAVPKCEPVR
jgi:4-diphosphocytidyl-2C-methyl-D-erythritol kinase